MWHRGLEQTIRRRVGGAYIPDPSSVISQLRRTPYCCGPKEDPCNELDDKKRAAEVDRPRGAEIRGNIVTKTDVDMIFYWESFLPKDADDGNPTAGSVNRSVG